MKSRLSLRAAGVLLLLATAATAALLARAPAPGDAEVDALRPVSPDSGAARKPAAPPKPKRQIVPGVEVVVNIPSGRLELVQGDSVV
ncbi:MAG TPA: hypothetical protein VFQ45_13285, partial [Longimicrobium sp.]|nr:hypothetical protein [Longimicrobium sp.]